MVASVDKHRQHMEWHEMLCVCVWCGTVRANQLLECVCSAFTDVAANIEMAFLAKLAVDCIRQLGCSWASIGINHHHQQAMRRKEGVGGLL